MSVCLWVKTVGGVLVGGDDTDERLAQREGKRLFAGHAGREKLFLIATEDSLHCCRDKYFNEISLDLNIPGNSTITYISSVCLHVRIYRRACA